MENTSSGSRVNTAMTVRIITSTNHQNAQSDSRGRLKKKKGGRAGGAVLGGAACVEVGGATRGGAAPAWVCVVTQRKRVPQPEQ